MYTSIGVLNKLIHVVPSRRIDLSGPPGEEDARKTKDKSDQEPASNCNSTIINDAAVSIVVPLDRLSIGARVSSNDRGAIHAEEPPCKSGSDPSN